MDCCESQSRTVHEHVPAVHTHGSLGMNHGSAATYLNRFWIVTVLLIPLALMNPMVGGLLHIPAFGFNRWIEFGLATVIFCFSLVFFQHAWHEIKMRKFGMMTLVSLAVGAGYAFSVVSTFVPSLNAEFYLEIGTLIWVLLFGHYLEARSSSAAGDALAEVAKLLPKQVHKLVDGVETEIDIVLLVEGDTVLVKPGEKIPADGVILKGNSNVDESLISGESKPVGKKDGATVVAGSIALDGSLTIRLTRVGEYSTIGQIRELIVLAGQTKPRSERIADQAAAWLTFIALAVALLTIAVWSLLLGQTFVFALTLAITVLVIACPHALGLAIPTVTTIATSLAVKNGVFIKDLAKIETIRKADYIVFDKTGTLTKGVFGVTDVVSTSGVSAEEVLRVAASLDQHSSHIVGQSIVAYAKREGILLSDPSEVKNIAGKGMRGMVSGMPYSVGNKALMKESGIIPTEAAQKAKQLAESGNTVVYVADTTRVLGFITLADEIRPESFNVVEKLRTLGIKVALLTGDNEAVAKGVADLLKVDTYFSEVLPEDKYRHIKALQDKGNIVLMVGDGVNDAPALAQADVGIAIGAGTDVAVEAGDVILTRSNPEDVARLIILARAVYRKMTQNLSWALGYNVLAIPTAAGIFAAWGFFLRPEIGALLMSASTVIVVLNALSLRRLNFEHV
jgi:P-type Cu2+ transporter